MIVTNNTNHVATVFELPNCQGLAIGQARPNESNVFEFGTSVSIS
ncbi:hypothetical protein ACEYXF_38165 [Streptomyces asiaticus]